MYKTRGKRVRLVFEFIAPRTITLAETVEFIEEAVQTWGGQLDNEMLSSIITVKKEN